MQILSDETLLCEFFFYKPNSVHLLPIFKGSTVAAVWLPITRKTKPSTESDIPFILLCSREDTLLDDCSLLSDSSVVPGVASEESVRDDVVLVRSAEVTVRCHDGMPGAAGVEPTIGEGNCFL